MWSSDSNPQPSVHSDSIVFQIKFVASFQLFVFRRRQEAILTRQFTDTRHFTDNLRLRGAMLNHHMPWSYDSLFAGYGETSEAVHVEDFDDILPVTGRWNVIKSLLLIKQQFCCISLIVCMAYIMNGLPYNAIQPMDVSKCTRSTYSLLQPVGRSQLNGALCKKILYFYIM